MIKVTGQTREFTPVERYLLTVSPTIRTVKTLNDGDVIDVAGYLEFIDEKEDGTTELMSIITTDRAVFTTQSVTFKRSIKDIETAMQGCFPFPVKKITGQSKAGRDYVDCVLDIDSLKEE